MKVKTVLSAIALASVATMATAKEADITKNWPELNDDAATVSSLASTSMKCFVDTPAYDQYRTGSCFAAGSSRTTTAVFKIDGVPSNFRIYWSDSRCSQTSSTCMLPISWYQTISLSADVLDLTNNTFSSTSATAHYEGLF